MNFVDPPLDPRPSTAPLSPSPAMVTAASDDGPSATSKRAAPKDDMGECSPTAGCSLCSKHLFLLLLLLPLPLLLLLPSSPAAAVVVVVMVVVAEPVVWLAF